MASARNRTQTDNGGLMSIVSEIDRSAIHRPSPRQYASAVAKSAAETAILIFADFATFLFALAFSVRGVDAARMVSQKESVTPWLGSSVSAHFICFLLIAVLLPLWLM